MLSEPEKRNIKSVWAQKVSLTSKKISGIPLKIGFLTPSEIVQKFLIKIFFDASWAGKSRFEVSFCSRNFLNFTKNFDQFQGFPKYVRYKENYWGKTDDIIVLTVSKHIGKNFHRQFFERFWNVRFIDMFWLHRQFNCTGSITSREQIL